MRERLLTRRNEAADRVRHLSKYPKLGAMAVAQEDLQICNLAIRALQLEGEQGDPAKDQRGAAAICPNGLLPDGPECPRCGGERGPSGVDGGSWVHCPPATHHHSRTEQFEWVEIGFNARLDAEPAPHHHSRTEQVDRNLTPENQARIEDTFQGLVSQHFDCHYNGEPSKCDKDCAQLGYCKRRTSEPAPAREPSAVEEVIQELREQYFCGTLVQRVERVIRQQQEELDRLRLQLISASEAEEDAKRLRAENAALREQLQGGVVVPRESGSLELGDSPHLLAFMVELHSHLPEGKRPYGWADFSDEQRTRIKRAYDAMLAAAKEPKHG